MEKYLQFFIRFFPNNKILDIQMASAYSSGAKIRTVFDNDERFLNLRDIMAIQSVKRALDILSFFSASTPLLGITDISRQMDLPKPTVHGLVQTLVNEGFLSQDETTRKYTLGLKIYELGIYLLGTLKINQVGLDQAQRLSRKTAMKSRLAIWDKNSVLVTASLFPDADNHRLNRIGPRLPAYCSGLGKSILSGFSDTELNAYLSQIPLLSFTPHTITDPDMLKKQIEKIKLTGYALDREEYLLNISCISSPIFDHSGKIVAAVSISSRPEDLTETKMVELAADVRQTAMNISGMMGFFPDPLKGGFFNIS